MHSLGGNTGACNCIARFMPWVWLHVKIVHDTMHDARDIAFFPVAARKLTYPWSNIVNTSPLHMCIPFPTFFRWRVMPRSPRQGSLEVADLNDNKEEEEEEEEEEE